MALLDELKQPKDQMSAFFGVTLKVLAYLPAVIEHTETVKGYHIHRSSTGSNTLYTRPIRIELFLYQAEAFSQAYQRFMLVLEMLDETNPEISAADRKLIDQVLYTIQQACGVGFDLLGKANSARKHVGNRFEELMRAVFSQIGIANEHTVLQIPYAGESGQKTYRCENDMILSSGEKVKSGKDGISPNEVVVSIKTTSKDRMGKIFIDKMLLENFTQQRLKVIGIFHNDVQRKESDGVSHTLVSGLFLVYTQFLTQLEGIYYLDLPPVAQQTPHNQHIKSFSSLLASDLWRLLSP